jgi:drug/metabolite transporter (DMT)-like permease
MDNKKESSLSPILGLVAGIFAVSSASLLIRFAQREAPSIVIAMYRMVISAVVLSPFFLRKAIKEIAPLDKKTKLLLTLSGTFLALHFTFWITSLEYTTVASSVVLVTTAPLWVALFSPFFLNEKLNKWILGGLAVSLIGSIVVGISGSCSFSTNGFSCQNLKIAFTGRIFWGDLMALLGAFLSGGYLMIGRKVRGKVSLPTYIYSVYSVSAIVLLLLVIITREKFTGYSTETYIWMIGLAVIPQLIGHSVFNWALKYLSAAYVSISLLGEPIGTVILTMIFLHESPATLEIIGGALILIGIGLATFSQRKN